MKIASRILLLFIIIFIFSIHTCEITNDVDVEEFSIHEMNTLMENITIEKTQTIPKQLEINCFDVNSKNMIAIGLSNLETKYIAIYTKEGEYRYAFKFSSSGDFGLKWDENNLVIFFIRSDVVIKIDETGNILNAYKLKDTLQNQEYIRNVVFSKSKTRNEVRYFADTASIFSTGYSQLIAKDIKSNDAKIIYDVTSFSLIKDIMKVISSALLFIGGGVAIKKSRNKTEK